MSAEEAQEDPGDVACAFECEASSVEWTVVDAAITEELNDPYQLSLSLRTDEEDADATEMLGESCTVTLERGEDPRWRLTDSGRYAHGADHVREAASRAGLTVVRLAEDVLRREYGEPARALVAVLRGE